MREPGRGRQIEVIDGANGDDSDTGDGCEC